MRVLNGIAPLAERYDGFIVDLWGVVHDGTAAYPGVEDALERLLERGRPVVFLSNVPRRAAVVEAQLTSFGVPRNLYRAVVSSGEASWELLRDRRAADAHPFFAALGDRAFHLGPERDRSVTDGLGLTLAGAPAEAGFVINTGPDFERGPDSVEPYDGLLRECVAVALPMICVNPDREVVVAGRRTICAGALADRYRALGGGPVIEVGKPDPAIYGPVLRRLGLLRERVLAVGDGPRTDLLGAKAAGLDSAWVLNGLSAGLADATLDAVAAAEGVSPVVALRGFRW